MTLQSHSPKIECADRGYELITAPIGTGHSLPIPLSYIGQDLSQDSETGYPKLAFVKSFGLPTFHGKNSIKYAWH